MLSTCSVCLKSDIGLINVSETDSNGMKWSTKLAICVPEVHWLEDFLICNTCVKQLEMVYAFRDMCLNSNTFRHAQEKCENEDEASAYGLNTMDSQSTDDENPPGQENFYICYHCSKGFRNKVLLIKHIKVLHMLSSDERNKSYATEKTIKEHWDENKTQVDEETSESNSRTNEESLSDALGTSDKKQKTRITKFTCESCPEFFNTSKKLVKHAMDVHGKDRRSVKPFQCAKCESRFASSSNLVQHKKYHDGNRTNICTYCGKGFITTSDLINHEKQHLNKRDYKCQFCLKGFNTHKDLRSHKIIKHMDPSTWNYHCTLCDKRFHIKPNYDNHMRRHMGDKRFSCRLCEKLFVTKDELRKHMTSHSNVRAFRCSYGPCDKEYKDKRVLDLHMAKVHGVGDAKIPVRVKKHRCNVCPKTFYDKNKLLRHLCTHSGDRPFACEMCNRKFTDKSYLKHHTKSAHKIYETDLYK